jgi:hypothetical protein
MVSWYDGAIYVFDDVIFANFHECAKKRTNYLHRYYLGFEVACSFKIIFPVQFKQDNSTCIISQFKLYFLMKLWTSHYFSFHFFIYKHIANSFIQNVLFKPFIEINVFWLFVDFISNNIKLIFERGWDEKIVDVSAFTKICERRLNCEVKIIQMNKISCLY